MLSPSELAQLIADLVCEQGWDVAYICEGNKIFGFVVGDRQTIHEHLGSGAEFHVDQHPIPPDYN